jgi:hypothetical protein
MEQDYLAKDFGTGLSFTATPKKKGNYFMDVSVCAKGIYANQHKLTIEVV